MINGNKSRLKYVELTEEMKQKMPANDSCCNQKSVPNAPKFIVEAAQSLKDHREYDASFFVGLMQTYIASVKWMSNNVKINGIVQDLFRVSHMLSPNACTFLQSILGF